MNAVRIDIVSDVVCPWCVVGYRQLEKAFEQSQQAAEIHWHPFELNPTMAAEGQDLTEHIQQKYGTTAQQSQENRQRLTDIGAELGIEFNFNASSRMVNTFKAHQLLHWANEQGCEHRLKLALFSAYFTGQKDVSNEKVLIDITESIGLDAVAAREVLDDRRFADTVREREQLWTSRGIQGVPAMVFNQLCLVTGAQGVDSYVSVLTDPQIQKKSPKSNSI